MTEEGKGYLASCGEPSFNVTFLTLTQAFPNTLIPSVLVGSVLWDISVEVFLKVLTRCDVMAENILNMQDLRT